MTKSFFSHFGTMVLLHLAILFGSYKVVTSPEVQKVIIPRYGNGIMKLKVSAGLFMKDAPQVSKPVLPKPEKKVVTSKPTPFQKQMETPKVEPVSAPASSDEGSALGRADGTGGDPNGYTFGNGNRGSGKYTALDLYKAELRSLIDKNKYYPTMSKRLGQTGTVVVAFTLTADGHIIDVRIDKPSQYERLNVSALDAVKKVERFKPIPKEAGGPKMDIKVPVKFVTI